MKFEIIVNKSKEVISGKTTNAVLKKVIRDVFPESLCLDFTEIYDSSIKGINFSYISLAGSNLSYTEFVNCLFDTCDFKNCDIQGSIFTCCDFEGAKNITSFGPVGRERRIGYVVNHNKCQMVKLGCFWGPLKEAVEEIRYKYGTKSTYEAYLKAAAASLKEKKDC